MRTSGKIEIRAIALEAIHHGAGMSGNTQLLRVQEIVLPDGTKARVPFISGNSMKHRIRCHSARYALAVLDIPEHSLTKGEVDLLFSGGRLTKTGTAVDLSRARELERLFPALSMCGYSAGNCMTESKLRVSHLHIVCAENAWRLPDDLLDVPHAAIRGGAFRGEEFGTRHDKGQSNDALRLMSAPEQKKIADKKTRKLKGSNEASDSTQMIYDFQTILPGATLFGSIDYADLTDMECAALASAFHLAASARRGDRLVLSVGAKSSIGFGAVAATMKGTVRAAAADYTPSEELVGAHGANTATAYQEHLKGNRSAILDAIKAAAG